MELKPLIGKTLQVLEGWNWGSDGKWRGGGVGEGGAPGRSRNIGGAEAPSSEGHGAWEMGRSLILKNWLT